MPEKRRPFQGKIYTFPDEATDAQIEEFLKGERPHALTLERTPQLHMTPEGVTYWDPPLAPDEQREWNAAQKTILKIGTGLGSAALGLMTGGSSIGAQALAQAAFQGGGGALAEAVGGGTAKEAMGAGLEGAGWGAVGGAVGGALGKWGAKRLIDLRPTPGTPAIPAIPPGPPSLAPLPPIPRGLVDQYGKELMHEGYSRFVPGAPGVPAVPAGPPGPSPAQLDAIQMSKTGRHLGAFLGVPWKVLGSSPGQKALNTAGQVAQAAGPAIGPSGAALAQALIALLTQSNDK